MNSESVCFCFSIYSILNIYWRKKNLLIWITWLLRLVCHYVQDWWSSWGCKYEWYTTSLIFWFMTFKTASWFSIVHMRFFFLSFFGWKCDAHYLQMTLRHMLIDMYKQWYINITCYYIYKECQLVYKLCLTTQSCYYINNDSTETMFLHKHIYLDLIKL